MSVAQAGAVERPIATTSGRLYRCCNPNHATNGRPDLTNTLRSEIRAHLVAAENKATEAAGALRLDNLPHVGTCIRRGLRELAAAAEKLRPGYVEPIEHVLKAKDDLIRKQGEELQQWRAGQVTEEMLRKNGGVVHVGNGCEIAVRGTTAHNADLVRTVQELTDMVYGTGAVAAAVLEAQSKLP